MINTFTHVVVTVDRKTEDKNEMRPHISSTFAEIVFIKLCKTHTHTHMSISWMSLLNWMKSKVHFFLVLLFSFEFPVDNQIKCVFDGITNRQSKKKKMTSKILHFHSFRSMPWKLLIEETKLQFFVYATRWYCEFVRSINESVCVSRSDVFRQQCGDQSVFKLLRSQL